MKNPSETDGFSLLEIMLVIAIIFILAVMGSAVFSKMSERANSAACVQNLKNIHALTSLTMMDNNGAIPWYDKSKSGYNGLWWHQIYQSSGMKPEELSKIFTCPTSKKLGKLRQIPLPGGKFLEINYVYNKRLGYNDGSGYLANYTLKKLQVLRRPAALPIVADASHNIGDNAWGFDEWNQVYSAHRGETYGNVLFLDGHVEQIQKPASGQAVEGNYDLKATNQ